MKFDLHTHHFRCGHAVGGLEDYIHAAIDQGLKIIGLSDHSPFFGAKEDHPFPGLTMARSEWQSYLQECIRLKEKYKAQIEVLIGVESDFIPEHAATYRQYYEQAPLDYIIGSVHYSGGHSIFKRDRFDSLTEEQKVAEKEEYQQLIMQSAKSGMFDILGHIDAMKAYYPPFSDIPSSHEENMLKTIAECGVAIEINTSGKTKWAGGWYPSDDLLERAHYYGVEVTLGSDAHKPERVGDDFELVQQKLQEIGFTEWVCFRQRQKYSVPFE